jgi:hypothetical protein
MLEGVALELARRAWTVTAVARRAKPLELLASKGCERIIPVSVDYTEPGFGAILGSGLRSACERDGIAPPTICAAWIHSIAPDAPVTVARALRELADPNTVSFIHILSRLRTPGPRDPSTPVPFDQEQEMRAIKNLNYRQAVLGWVVTPGGSRWLTHSEISKGVLRAIDSEDSVTEIGQTEPIETSPDYV